MLKFDLQKTTADNFRSIFSITSYIDAYSGMSISGARRRGWIFRIAAWPSTTTADPRCALVKVTDRQ